jgi:hypothetical protein
MRFPSFPSPARIPDFLGSTYLERVSRDPVSPLWGLRRIHRGDCRRSYRIDGGGDDRAIGFYRQVFGSEKLGWTANPVQTTRFFGVRRGFFLNAADGGESLPV